MGKPTFDLCYSEEGMRWFVNAGHTRVGGKRMAVGPMGEAHGTSRPLD